MSGALATILEPTLSESVDTLLLLVRSASGGSCLWCGSPRLEASEPVAGHGFAAEIVTITCQGCGAELESSRSVANRDRHP